MIAWGEIPLDSSLHPNIKLFLLELFVTMTTFLNYPKNCFIRMSFISLFFLSLLSFFLSAQGGQSYLEDADGEGAGRLGRPDHWRSWLQTITTRHHRGSCGERWSRTEVTPTFQALSGNHALSWQRPQRRSWSVLHPYATRHGFSSALPSNFKATVASVFKLIWNLYRRFTIIESDSVHAVGDSFQISFKMMPF